jgi:Ca2+/Na+ antiporter
VTTKAIVVVVGVAALVSVIQAITCLLDRDGVVLCVLILLVIVGRVVWARTGDHW